MTFKRKVAAFVAICITAILVIAVGGCDDLGAYEDTKEYYNSFGDVVFVGGAAGEGKGYSVEEYFYNTESRDDFLVGEDGVYHGVEHSDYVYVAIPFTKDIKMDSLAMFLQANDDVAVHINVYVTDEIPTNWKKLEDLTVAEESTDVSSDNLEDLTDEESTEASSDNFEDITDAEESFDVSSDNLEENITEIVTDTSDETSVESSTEATSETSDTTTEEVTQTYDDPDPDSRIGEITLYLKGGAWNSFTLDTFKVDNKVEKSIYVEEGQYILLQIRNNSGVRVFDEDKQLYVDEQTGLVLEKAEITMTNLLVRALEIENKTEAKEE